MQTEVINGGLPHSSGDVPRSGLACQVLREVKLEAQGPWRTSMHGGMTDGSRVEARIDLYIIVRDTDGKACATVESSSSRGLRQLTWHSHREQRARH